jgi:hypothetical protein
MTDTKPTTEARNGDPKASVDGRQQIQETEGGTSSARTQPSNVDRSGQRFPLARRPLFGT